MAHFDLSNYETVASRITRFWQDYPNGRSATEIVHISESGKQFVIKAMVYRDISDPQPIATGLAEEHFADRGPNETSPCENGETSAIGRALVNWYMSSTAESRPSREEMSKVNNGSSAPRPERVKEIAQQVRSTSPKIDPKTDERWGWIVKASRELPDDHKSHSFVTDIAGKGAKWELSEKQIAAAFKASCEYLGQPSPSDMAIVEEKVQDVFEGAVEVGVFAHDESPF